MDPNPEQSQHQHQHPYPYPYEGKKRIFYTLAGMVFTGVGALFIMRSRFVQTFVAPKPTDPTASPSITVVNPKQLYRYFHHHLPTIVAMVTAIITALFPVLFLAGRWVHARLHRLGNVFTRIMVRIFSFSLSTVAFYMATRVGTKIFMYHHLPVPHNLKVLTHDVKKIFDLHFEVEEEIQNLLFLDPWTIAAVALFSLLSLCLARLMPNPEGYYHMHEVSLDLTCHLAGDYFGANTFNSVLVFVSCLIIVIAKELTEPRRRDPPATPAEHGDDHCPQEPPPAHQEMVPGNGGKGKMVSLNGGSGENCARRRRNQIEADESSTGVRGSTGDGGRNHDRIRAQRENRNIDLYVPVEICQTSREGGIWDNTSNVPMDEDEVTSTSRLDSIITSMR